VPANLLSIGAIDFGIIIDGTVVMMETFTGAGRPRGQEYKLHEVIAAAARDLGRPIFYLSRSPGRIPPIYALTGPSGKLFVRGGNDHTRCWVR